jgi:hypothetical protein
MTIGPSMTGLGLRRATPEKMTKPVRNRPARFSWRGSEYLAPHINDERRRGGSRSAILVPPKPAEGRSRRTRPDRATRCRGDKTGEPRGWRRRRGDPSPPPSNTIFRVDCFSGPRWVNVRAEGRSHFSRAMKLLETPIPDGDEASASPPTLLRRPQDPRSTCATTSTRRSEIRHSSLPRASYSRITSSRRSILKRARTKSSRISMRSCDSARSSVARVGMETTTRTTEPPLVRRRSQPSRRPPS